MDPKEQKEPCGCVRWNKLTVFYCQGHALSLIAKSLEGIAVELSGILEALQDINQNKKGDQDEPV